MELFDTIENLDFEKKKYLEDYLSSINNFPYIYLWWISESCDEAIKFFNKNDINIKGIYELNPDKYDYEYKNIPVIKQTFDTIDEDWAIVITCSYFETIKDKLLVNYKNIEKKLFLFDGYFLENNDSKYYLDNKDEILNCYNSLADEKSKILYNALLKYRYIRNPNLIKDLYESRYECYLDKVFIDKFKDWLYKWKDFK